MQSHKMHRPCAITHDAQPHLSTQSISSAYSIHLYSIHLSISHTGYLHFFIRLWNGFWSCGVAMNGVYPQRMAYTLNEWRIPSRLVLFISFSYTVHISLRVHTYRVYMNLRVHTTPQSRPILSMRMNTKVTECARAARRC